MKSILIIAGLTCFSFINGYSQKQKRVERIEKSIIVETPKKMLETNEQEEIVVDAPRVKVYHFSNKLDTLREGETEMKYGEGTPWKNEFPNINKRNRQDPSKYRYNVRDFSKPLRDDFRLNSKNIEQEGLSKVAVFTNKPDSHILNVRFKSSSQENVHISVLTLMGDKVSTVLVKDFSGEYLGQVELPKKSSGTYFVIISQGEKGVSRKVKVD